MPAQKYHADQLYRELPQQAAACQHRNTLKKVLVRGNQNPLMCAWL